MADKPKIEENANAAEVTFMNSLSELQKSGLGSLTWMGTAWLENMSDMTSEVLSFVSDRVKEDVKTQHEILHCKDVAQLQHIQAQFLQKAMDQYAAETGRIVEMSNSFLNDAQERAKKQ